MHTPVLIVGGGPSGLVLALSLLLNGVNVRIIDKELSHRTGSKGNGISPKSLEVYRFLGLLPALEAKSSAQRELRSYDPQDGTKVISTKTMMEEDEPTPAYPYVNYRTLGQDQLEGIFREHLQRQFGVEVELGTELVTFQREPNSVTAWLRRRTSEGSTGTEEVVATDYVVGCDGGHSGVRKGLGISFEGETLPGRQLYGDVHVEGLDIEYWHTWGDPRNVLIGLWSVSKDPQAAVAFRCFGGNAPGPEELAQDPERVSRLIHEVSGREDLKIGKWTYLNSIQVSARMVERFGDDERIFLAGDAAHIHSPAGAQGLNSSIQDSFNLGWKLALAYKGLASSALLASYSAERVPVIREMLERTSNVHKGMHGGGGPGPSQDRSGRPGGLAAPGPGGPSAPGPRGPSAPGPGGLPAPTSGGPPGGRGAWGPFKQLGVHCEWSPIVTNELPSDAPAFAPRDAKVDTFVSAGALRPGNRAPDAPGLVVLSGPPASEGAAAVSLFDLFSPARHTALVFVAAAAQPEAVRSMLNALRAAPETLVRVVLVLRRRREDLADMAEDGLIVFDHGGHAFSAYQPCRYGVVAGVIVRPDAMVGAIVHSEKGVTDYLGRVLNLRG